MIPLDDAQIGAELAEDTPIVLSYEDKLKNLLTRSESEYGYFQGTTLYRMENYWLGQINALKDALALLES